MSKLSYREFIAAKMPLAEQTGFEPPSDPHPSLKPHQSDIASWMVRGGRRACFAGFGLGKSRKHLQVAKWVSEHTGLKYLIVAPLGVRQEFTKSEGPAMGMDVRYCRNDEEVRACPAQFIITNYERVRDGNITLNPTVFGGAGLDEGSTLRSYGSQTFQTFRQIFKPIPYRFVFTATPSPNRHKELIHYADFLGVMDSGLALTRWFKRDPQKAGNLTLYPHHEETFWLWLSSWAVFLQSPSDLGYDATGYDLPPLNVHWHRVEVDHTKAWNQLDSWGQAQLFLDQSSNLAELAEVKRDTMVARLQKALSIMSDGQTLKAPPPANGIDEVIDQVLNHVQNQHVLRELLAGKSWGEAFGIGGGSHPASWMGSAKGIEFSGELIKPKRIMVRAKEYASGRHWILWHDLEAERHLIERTVPGVRTAYGTQDLEEREETILGFGRGEFPILATKPVVAGSGTNLQRHCHSAIFLGASFKFNDVIQACHRIHRFQQGNPVVIHFIYSEAEEVMVRTLQAKWRQHDELVARMVELLKKFKLSLKPGMELKRSTDCERAEVKGERFRAIRNDCVLETKEWEPNTVDLIVTSIPFGTMYEYSPSFLDMGHNLSNEAFFEQLGYLVPQLLRVLRPGRLACIHVKDRIRFGAVTGKGVPTVDRFSDKAADLFERCGFDFIGRITIDTDVVRENNQTYRLGWSENAKDSTKMGCGMPEYVLLCRKPQSDTSRAYADVPVTKKKNTQIGWQCPKCKAEFKNLDGVKELRLPVENDLEPPPRHKCPKCREHVDMAPRYGIGKDCYTRSDWQVDAAGLWRSNGNRLPDPEVLANLPTDVLGRIWRDHCRKSLYDWKEHVELAKELEKIGRLPAAFMLFPPVSRHPDVWTDIARMRVLNSEQSKRQMENHICPLALDLVERLIIRYSNEGETVYDPFGGIGTVPYVAIQKGRIGWGTELSNDYWKAFVGYCEQAEAEREMPTLFDWDREAGGVLIAK